jgi:TRAP-type C4-dicarboxylate transport system substrate-binding protein
MMVKGRFPVMEAIELPLGYPSGYIASHVACDLYDKVKPKEFDQYYPLMFSASPPSVVQTLRKRVNTLEDIKGLKIRAPGRLADTMKALGATPLPLEMADLYESLRRGVIDGNYGPVEQLKGWKIGELIKYAAATWKVGNTASFYVIMNKAKWDNLPPDVKKLFQEVSAEYKEKWAVAWTQQEIEGSEFLKSNGGQITPISNTEIVRWIKATRPVLDIYKDDLAGRGYKAQEVETWFSFIQERVEYWKDKEKANNIPKVYQY